MSILSTARAPAAGRHSAIDASLVGPCTSRCVDRVGQRLRVEPLQRSVRLLSPFQLAAPAVSPRCEPSLSIAPKNLVACSSLPRRHGHARRRAAPNLAHRLYQLLIMRSARCPSARSSRQPASPRARAPKAAAGLAASTCRRRIQTGSFKSWCRIMPGSEREPSATRVDTVAHNVQCGRDARASEGARACVAQPGSGAAGPRRRRRRAGGRGGHRSDRSRAQSRALKSISNEQHAN